MPLTSKRTDWDKMVSEVGDLIERLRQKPERLRLGYQQSPESILNAFREGDLDFRGAVLALKRWRDAHR
mgnify:CR=1 FL=1